MRRYLTALGVLFFLFGANAQDETPIGCYVPGKCEHSQLVSIEVEVPNVDDCLEFCNSTGDDCLYFSYDGSTDICYAYATCDLSTDPCSGCMSGDFNCTQRPCFANGTCIGNDVGITIETTQEGCREECLGNTNCEYFSYDKENNLCILFEDCDVDITCLTCVYGNRDCHLSDGGLTKILIVGGHINAPMVDSELIDMASSLTCEDPADFPMPIHGYVAAFINDVVWYCGGSSYNNMCHTYNSTANSWQNAIPMLAVRFWASSALIKGGTEWWIVGGRSSSTTYLDSTEVWRNGEFSPGVDLPENISWPCLVSINNTHVFLAGGLYATGASSAKAYIVELEGGQDWQAVTDMMTARWGHTCNLVFTTEFGNEIVVAGGAGTQTEIYSLDEDKWRVGPEFPRSLMEASSVPYQESFLVLGGSPNSDEIYQLILEDWTWEKKQQTLTTGRREFTALMLPDDQVNCH